MRFGNSVQYCSPNSPGPKWKPWNIGYPVPLAIVDDVIPFTVSEAIAVLHRDDRDNCASALDMFLSHVRQCDESDLLLVLQLSQSFHRSIEGHDRVGDVQLINIDTVQPQSLETALDSLLKVRGIRVVRPLVRAGAIPPAFGSDY